MRILYLADIRFPLERANGIQTIETCHALARRGHDVTLLVRPDTASPPRDPLVFHGLPPAPTLTIARAQVAGPPPMRRARYLATAIRRSLAQPRADVVLTRDLGAASLLTHWSRASRPALVYESHGYAPVVSGLMPDLLSGAKSASPMKARRLARREQRVWTRAEGYVTITRALANELASLLGARADVAVIPDGARVGAGRVFDWEGPARPAWVTYAGHLYPWKGVDTFLEALALTPDLRARIVGGHPAEDDLPRVRALAAQLGVDERVELTGMVPPSEVPRWLRASDVLVIPNRQTAMSARYMSPLKLFEYLVAGRPIVASNLPALTEVLRHDENALLVPPDDPRALAEALVRVTSDRGLAIRLARRAFDEAEMYSWDARAEKLERVLAAAVHGTGENGAAVLC